MKPSRGASNAAVYWALAAAWQASIFLTLKMTPRFVEVFTHRYGMPAFHAVMNLGVEGLAMVIFLSFLRSPGARDPVGWLWLFAEIFAGGTGLLVDNLQYPHEVLVKRIHLGNYWVQSFLVGGALLGRRGAFPAALGGIVVATLGGLTEEVLQYLTPGRNFAWSDVAIDALGATLASVHLTLVLRRRVPPDGD